MEDASVLWISSISSMALQRTEQGLLLSWKNGRAVQRYILAVTKLGKTLPQIDHPALRLIRCYQRQPWEMLFPRRW
jgi:hypothetical protein